MRVAIIGHGRSPEGRGWGSRIDACNLVVRMWDCHWQKSPDHGSRYDYGFLEAQPQLVRKFYEHRRRAPHFGFVASALTGALDCKLPEGTTLVHQRRWNDIGRSFGGIGATGRLQFTRGTIAACWAIEALCHVGSSLLLVGFDNVHQGRALPIEEGFSESYRAAESTFTFRGYTEGAIRYGNHDFACEGPTLEWLCEKHGVQLEFAQDLWP